MEPVDDILNRALKLSEKDRAKIAELLIRSLDPPGEELSEEEWVKAWGPELERRMAEADRGEFTEGDWREVLERARQSLKSEQPT